MNERLVAALADRYRLERELGQGGMATVYLAHDLKHEREVAIKVLREDLSASLGAGRFLREIKIAAQLQHPHILPLLDSGEADGFLYFVMPYIKGQSLRERLAREGELPVHEAVRLISEVVDALVEAHTHGVVHRDIKPDNVMLSGRHALVTDFGVAKAISEATGRNTITTLGVAVGTPTYMSPEQAAADPHVDHRSDIYSVGVMLYEMLSGRPPFTGTTPQQVLAAHVTEAPDPVGKRRASIPPALEQVVMRCLAKRPADRFQTAAELHAALEPLSTPSTGMTPVQTAPVMSSATRQRVWLTVGVIAVVAITGIVFAITRRTAAPTLPITPKPIQLTFSGRVNNVTLSPDGGYVTYHETRAECPQGMQCPYGLVLQETSPQGTRRVIDSSGTGIIAGWSPDGRRFFLGSSDNSGPHRALVTVLGGSVLSSINGRVAWTASPDSILVWDWSPSHEGMSWIRTVVANTGVAVDSFRFGPAEFINEVFASPDGRWLMVEFQHPGQPIGLVHLKTVTRQGMVVDSMPGLGVRWGSGSDRFYLTEARADHPWLVRQRIAANGRRAGSTEPVTEISTTDVSLAGDQLVFVERSRPQTELFAIEWSHGLTKPATTRSVYRTTAADAFGFIEQDGKSIIFAESRGNSTPGSYNTGVRIPFEGGTPQPIADLEKLVNRDEWPAANPTGVRTEWRDGHSAIVVYAGSLSTKVSAEQTLPTTFPDSGWVWVLPGRKVLWQSIKTNEFVVLSATGLIERRIPLPDTIRMGWMGTLLTADRATVTFFARAKNAAQDKFALYTLSLADTQFRRVSDTLPGRFQQAGGWSADGWLPLVLQSGSRHEMSRISIRDGKVVDDGPVPVPGNVIAFWIAADRRRASAVVTSQGSDIFLIRNFDPTAHR